MLYIINSYNLKHQKFLVEIINYECCIIYNNLFCLLDIRSKHRPKNRSCGRCENCKRVKDCGVCLGCFEMRKFGSVDLCENKKCLNVNNIQVNI